MPSPNAGRMAGRADKGARKGTQTDVQDMGMVVSSSSVLSEAQDPYKERVLPAQNRLLSPEIFWSESDEVSDEEIPPGNFQSLADRPAQEFRGSPSVTPSPELSPHIMDSVVQLIGYPDSDVEDESEHEVEIQCPSADGGQAQTFISPLASRLQTPQVPHKDSLSRKTTEKIDHPTTSIQKTLHSKPSVPFKVMATPNNKKRGPIYQSSSESDDGEDDNGRDDGSLRASSSPMSFRSSSQAASYKRSETPRQESPRISSQPSLGKIDRARINKVIAQSKLDTSRSRRSITPADSAISSSFKSPPSAASLYKQSSVKDLKSTPSGFTNYGASSRASTPQPYSKDASTAKKVPLPTSFGQKKPKPSPYIAEPVQFGETGSRKLASPSPNFQGPTSASPRAGPGSSAFTSKGFISPSPKIQGPGQTGSPPTVFKAGPPPPPTHTIFGTALEPTAKHPGPVPHLTARAISPKGSKVHKMAAPKKQTAHNAAKASRSPALPEESKASRSPAVPRAEPSSVSPKGSKVDSMTAPKKNTAHPATKTARSPTPAHFTAQTARAPTPSSSSKMAAAAAVAHATAPTFGGHATAATFGAHPTATNAAQARKTGGTSSSAGKTPAAQPTLGPFFSMLHKINTDFDSYPKTNAGGVAGEAAGAKGGLKTPKSAEADAREKKMGAVAKKETPRPGSPDDKEKKEASSSKNGKMAPSSLPGKDVAKTKPAASGASIPRPGSPDNKGKKEASSSKDGKMAQSSPPGKGVAKTKPAVATGVSRPAQILGLTPRPGFPDKVKGKNEASPPRSKKTASITPPAQELAKPKPAVATGTAPRPAKTPPSSLSKKDILFSKLDGKDPKVDGKDITPRTPVVSKTAPTDARKETPKSGRYTPQVHIRTPSGPTDFDVFIPPTPGMDVSSVSLATAATSGRPSLKDSVDASPPVLEKKGSGYGDATKVSRVDVKEGIEDGAIVAMQDGDVGGIKKDENGGVEKREMKTSVGKQETKDEKRGEDKGDEVHEGITIMTAMSTDPDVAANDEPSELKQDTEPFLESYFEYRIKQKLWPAFENEEDAVATTVGNTTTLVDTANREAEEFFMQMKEQYLSAFAVQHEQSSTSYNEGGCLELKCTLSSVGWPDKKVLLKVWVHRSTVPSTVVAFHQPPEHTPFISKTLYILRLSKITKVPSADGMRSRAETHDEAEDEADRTNEASPSDSGENSVPDSGSVAVPDDNKDDKKRKTQEGLDDTRAVKRRKIDSAEVAKGQGYEFVREYHEIPWPEVYTTIAGANSAACNLHIEMMQETVPLRKEQRKEANARLKGKLYELDGKQGKDGYWRSEIPIGFSGSSKFELVVDRVGLCGPRNV